MRNFLEKEGREQKKGLLFFFRLTKIKGKVFSFQVSSNIRKKDFIQKQKQKGFLHFLKGS
jgi:hypothetical protein